MITKMITMIVLLSVPLCSLGWAGDREQMERDMAQMAKEQQQHTQQDYADAAKPILVMDGVELGAAIKDHMRRPASIYLRAPDGSNWLSVNATIKINENSDGYFRPLKTIIYCFGYRPVVKDTPVGFVITFVKDESVRDVWNPVTKQWDKQ